jgi:8-oxo-dGTP pyrophosphatase MutT (NUDIX family)
MKQQASKEIVVAGLFSDEVGNILIVKPAHKDGWIFPGGYVEIGESPSEAWVREAQAELGLTITHPTRLLSIDYRGTPDEYVMFIFDGDTLTPDTIATISLPPSLTEFRFVSPTQAIELLRPNSARRLLPTLDARQKTGIAYLENQANLS